MAKEKLIQSSLFILIFCVLGCQKSVYKNDIPKILGVTAVEIQDVSVLSEVGCFSEGYVVESYKLSDDNISTFKQIETKSLPIKDGWKLFEWEKTPYSSKVDELLSMVLDYSTKNSKLNEVIEEMESILKSKDSYYSMYYKSDTINPKSIILHALSVKNKKLFITEVSY